jgi:cyclopropane fatty-acyl-phospholipid synthase-like methyltransferase
MRSEVLDLPQAVEHAQKLAREACLDDVVTHRPGNALENDLGHDYDAVFVGDVVHHFTLAQNRDLFRRVRDVMTPNGTVAIWDYERPDLNAEPELGGDGLALFFRITSTAQCYTSADYMDWISSAGFVDVKTHPTPFAPSHILVTGRAG